MNYLSWFYMRLNGRMGIDWTICMTVVPQGGGGGGYSAGRSSSGTVSGER
jgi:hypothetical protein